MQPVKSDFLSTITERGFVHQCTDMEALDALLAESNKPVVAYCGFDCTAPSLHIGSLIQIMLLRWYQKCGGKPIVLMGGATTKIGDPSGKDESRKILTDAEIESNMHGIADVFGNYIAFGDGPTDAMMVNNIEWLSKLELIDFLRDYGRFFSINRMVTMDSVRLRLEREQEMSLLEFNYMIMQAYDFVKLNELHKCRLQFGGSDQWGNIIGGINLAHAIAHARVQGARILDYKDKFQLYGLTTPLLTTASGAKMGKTAEGAVWLNGEMTSPYDYWQYWRNTEDADVGKFLRLFTELPMEEIRKFEKLEGVHINEAKKILANEATTLCHGEAASLEAAETARSTFEEGTMGEALPQVRVARADLEKGIAAYKLFQLAGMAESASEARRLIKGGGAKVNDRAVPDENQPIFLEDMMAQGFIKLSAGKKRHALVKAV